MWIRALLFELGGWHCPFSYANKKSVESYPVNLMQNCGLTCISSHSSIKEIRRSSYRRNICRRNGGLFISVIVRKLRMYDVLYFSVDFQLIAKS